MSSTKTTGRPEASAFRRARRPALAAASAKSSVKISATAISLSIAQLPADCRPHRSTRSMAEDRPALLDRRDFAAAHKCGREYTGSSDQGLFHRFDDLDFLFQQGTDHFTWRDAFPGCELRQICGISAFRKIGNRSPALGPKNFPRSPLLKSYSDFMVNPRSRESSESLVNPPAAAKPKKSPITNPTAIASSNTAGTDRPDRAVAGPVPP